jgi:hypothetical protein
LWKDRGVDYLAELRSEWENVSRPDMMTWYDDVMRTIIELPEAQVRALAAYCARAKVSRAEAIRRAVNELLAKSEQDRAEDEAAFKAAFGMWKNRGIDGVDYQRQLRAEWDRD